MAPVGLTTEVIVGGGKYDIIRIEWNRLERAYRSCV